MLREELFDMDFLLHPIAWCIVFLFGIFNLLKYFNENISIFRRMLAVEMILFLMYVIDLKSTKFISEKYFVQNYFVPILLIGIFFTMYVEDYKKFQVSEKDEEEKRSFRKLSMQYLVVILFFVVVYWFL